MDKPGRVGARQYRQRCKGIDMYSPGGHTGSTYLRLSITDGCNLSCHYCRPESGPLEPEASPLADETELLELVRLIDRATGIHKLRLSGGEPLVHPRVVELVARLRSMLPAARLCLTTNGILLPRYGASLRRAGLQAVNVSLDSLDPDRFRDVTGGGQVESTLSGIRAAVNGRFDGVQVNTVLIRRINGDQLADLVRFAAGLGCEIRFIELMPFGLGSPIWQSDYLPADEALDSLKQDFPYLGEAPPSGTASRHRLLVDGRPATIGMISPVSKPFCSRCDRLRLSRKGQLYACLRQASRADLLAPLRAGDLESVCGRIQQALRDKQDPGQQWPDRPMISIGG
ncbi:MAG: GTP 3',8-cyclase MoaA [Thermoguttaceae bacterium]